jgi:ATP-binding cassette subfamily B protein
METEPEIAVQPEVQKHKDAGKDAVINSAQTRGHLEFVIVSFRYGEKLENVLENISLEIWPGESVALVGSSGVGKTTLCSLIPRFYELTGGKILLDRTDISMMDLGTLRRNIGVVAQDVYLFDGTILENINYGKPGASMEEAVEAAKRANIHDFIQNLPGGYGTEIGQRGIRLSGGQRQRLSIARMFLKNPPVLILDEATSALDYESERLIHESLDSFMRDRTTLIVAHRLSTIRKAGRVVSLTEQGARELEKARMNTDAGLE